MGATKRAKREFDAAGRHNFRRWPNNVFRYVGQKGNLARLTLDEGNFDDTVIYLNAFVGPRNPREIGADCAITTRISQTKY